MNIFILTDGSKLLFAEYRQDFRQALAFSFICPIYAFLTPFPIYLSIMGKSQSKLSQEQLADLQKNTYCTSTVLPHFDAIYRLDQLSSRQEGTASLVRLTRSL